jgi:hypothetical protein
MSKTENRDYEFPEKMDKFSKEELAKVLRKALSEAEKLKTQSDVAKATGINEKSIGDYFTARYKPPQKRWDLLRKVLFIEDKIIKPTKSFEGKKLEEAKHLAERLKALLFLIKDELEYFKNSSPEARNILKLYIPGSDTGLLVGLLTALYDEDQLQAYKTFTNMKE